MTQNIYTTQFYTKAETNSRINQKATEIEIGVDETLSNYSTTAQMNSAINVKANEITSSVSETYATKTTTNTLSSRISQTAKNISLTVNNGSTSSGITIGITKEDGTTTTTSGTIQMNGLVKFTDLSGSGTTTINGSNITTGTISADRVSGGTLSGSTIIANTGSIGRFNITETYLETGSGSTNAGIGGNAAFWAGSDSSMSAPFHVTYAGKLYATGAEISGKITATSGTFTGKIYAQSGGTIGNWTITSSGITGSYGGYTTTLTPRGFHCDTGTTNWWRNWWQL